MRRRYHCCGFTGETSSFMSLSLVLFGLVCWFLTLPVVGVPLLLAVALCLASEPAERNPFDPKVSLFGVTTAVVSLTCVIGPMVWLVGICF